MKVCYQRVGCIQFFPSGPRLESEHRDPAHMEVPDYCVGFEFFDMLLADATEDGEVVVLKSAPFDHSPRYYTKGTVYTLAELQDDPGLRSTVERLRGQRCLRGIVFGSGIVEGFRHHDVRLAAVLQRGLHPGAYGVHARDYLPDWRYSAV